MTCSIGASNHLLDLCVYDASRPVFLKATSLATTITDRLRLAVFVAPCPSEHFGSFKRAPASIVVISSFKTAHACSRPVFIRKCLFNASSSNCQGTPLMRIVFEIFSPERLVPRNLLVQCGDSVFHPSRQPPRLHFASDSELVGLSRQPGANREGAPTPSSLLLRR